MKKPFLLTLLIPVVLSCGQKDTITELLTGKWRLDKVENTEVGEFSPDVLNEGSKFIFHEDHTAIFEQDNEFVGNKNIDAIWTIQDSIVNLNYQDQNTGSFKIEMISSDKLILTKAKGAKLRFYFTRIVDRE